MSHSLVITQYACIITTINHALHYNSAFRKLHNHNYVCIGFNVSKRSSTCMYSTDTVLCFRPCRSIPVCAFCMCLLTQLL